jgi:hypothetical protein
MSWEKETIKVKLSNGNIWVIRKDRVHTLEYSYQSRNLGCKINGTPVESGYDQIVKELDWVVFHKPIT